jgi:hypothetical protein
VTRPALKPETTKIIKPVAAPVAKPAVSKP